MQVLRDLVEILPQLETTTDVRATKLRHGAERLIGRDADLTGLDAAWKNPHKNVVIVRAWGGVGKTSEPAALISVRSGVRGLGSNGTGKSVKSGELA